MNVGSHQLCWSECVGAFVVHHGAEEDVVVGVESITTDKHHGEGLDGKTRGGE